MKNALRIVLLSVLVLLLTVTSASAASDTIKVYLDGQAVDLTTEAVIESGRTLVPFRSIFEAVGMTVDWDQDTKTASGKNADTEIHLVIGSSTATVNGEAKTLDVPAEVRNGHTLVPLRFVSESVGKKVDWKNDKREVRIWTLDPAAVELYDKINASEPESDSIAVNVTADYDINTVENGVSSNVKMSLKGDMRTIADDSNPQFMFDMNIVADGESSGMKMLFSDNTLYYEILGQKVKMTMPADEALSQSQSVTFNEIEFENDIIKGAQILTASQSATQLSLVLDGEALSNTVEVLFNSLYGNNASLPDMDFTYDDVILKVTADENYTLKKMEMTVDAYVASGTDRAGMTMDIVMEITATGDDVKIDLPSDLSEYVEFDLGSLLNGLSELELE